MHAETVLTPADLIWPLFVVEGQGVEQPIASLPGMSRWSVDGIVARMRAELASGDQAACIATGGMATIIAGESEAIERVDPDLTLQGLRLIWDRNHTKNG